MHHAKVFSPLLFLGLMGAQLGLVPIAMADGLYCRDERLVREFSQSHYFSTVAPTAKLNVEQKNFHQTFKDIIALQPGHDVSLAVSGRIDVNRRYWSERKCKWLGLKCWYEPRERSNWQAIGQRPMHAKLCSQGKGNGCQSVPLINTDKYQGLKNAAAPQLRAKETDGLRGLTRRFELSSVIDGSGVHRNRCTGARPSTCSFGEYGISTKVDVKPRVAMLQKLLEKPQEIGDLLQRHVVDDFIRGSGAARKVAACLYFGHTQRFFPEVSGGANTQRERLLRFILELDPDNEYRAELTSLLITSGAIDEALGGADKQLNKARKRYEDSNHGESEANQYAKALLNRARLWIEDRVATEGADLEVAVGLFSELVRVRKGMLQKSPQDDKQLKELVRAQIEQARLLSLIRTGPTLAQAEKELEETLQWIPLDKSEEIAGENAARGLYASFSASNLPLSKGRVLIEGAKRSNVPVGSIHVHRVPSWSARPRLLTQLDGDLPPVWLKDDLQNSDGELWHPEGRQMPRSWRLFGSDGGCKNSNSLSYLGGGVGTVSKEHYSHTLYFQDPKANVLVHQPSREAGKECVKPDNSPSSDGLPNADEMLRVIDTAARLVYARGKKVFWVDATRGEGQPPIYGETEVFPSEIKKLVASTDDESVGAVVHSDEDGDNLIHTFVLGSVDASNEEKQKEVLFKHPIGEKDDGLVSLSSTLAFVRRGTSLDVFSRAKLTKKPGGLLSATEPELNIDISNTSDNDLYIHALGNDFVVMQLGKRANDSYGSQDVKLNIRVGNYRFDTELGPQDAKGFKSGVRLSFENEKRDRFTVRILAAGINGVLHKTRLDKGLRIASSEASGLTSKSVAILDATGMLLSTRVAKLTAISAPRNVPAFNGYEIDAVSRFCADFSEWGCRVAPISAPIPGETIGQGKGCSVEGVSDPLLLIAVGRDGGNGHQASSDVIARVRVNCDSTGRPAIAGEIEVLSDQFPDVAELESNSGDEYDKPVWRHVGPAGSIVQAGTAFVFASLPIEKIDPDGSDFGDRPIMKVPIRLVREAEVLGGTLSIRSPFGLRHILVHTKGDAVGSALVVADHPSKIVTYTGGAESVTPFVEVSPQRLVQAKFSVNGDALLLGKIDVNEADGQLIRIEPAVQGDGFTFSVLTGMNAVPLMSHWTARERLASYTSFDFFGATPDFEVYWWPDGRCTFIERSGADVVKFGVGRPAGVSHLRNKGKPTPITIQRGQYSGASKPELRRGAAFTQFWGDSKTGALGACTN